MIPTPEMAYAELVGNRLLVTVLAGARVLAIAAWLVGLALLHASTPRHHDSQPNPVHPTATAPVQYVEHQ